MKITFIQYFVAFALLMTGGLSHLKAQPFPDPVDFLSVHFTETHASQIHAAASRHDQPVEIIFEENENERGAVSRSCLERPLVSFYNNHVHAPGVNTDANGFAVKETASPRMMFDSLNVAFRVFRI